MKLSFVVYATPQPQGSIRAYMPRGWTRPVLTSDNRELKSFRQEVAKAAIAELRQLGIYQGEPAAGRGVPVHFTASFYFQKPKSAPKRVACKTTKPDLDKLLRSTLDALRGIAWADDAQVISAKVLKEFTCGPERAEVSIWAPSDAPFQQRLAG